MRAPSPPHVGTPIMIQHWRLLTFIHWRYPADVVQSLLPDGLEVETFDGSAWIGLVPFVLAGQAGYGLPYRWSAMEVRPSGNRLRYRASRRWPGPSGARCDAEVELGRPYDEAELGPLDHFLTARFRLYSTLAGRLVVADAEHPPWPLFSARLHELRQDLVQAAGLPAPAGEPLLHASPGVRVRIGMWQPVRAGRRRLDPTF
ncbi:MAG: hypothetical protein AUI14_11155 [Actinobacteria bacterium 13_2_20CM_2_71_6]|nr:MAG: hypothetical protein AUI14_11155 [Actinobacteria bacterium 13_2_20CM_2_71_6]